MDGNDEQRIRAAAVGVTWPAYGACVVASVYAVVSFYWALGGTAGIGTLGGTLEELARAGDPVVLWLAGAAGLLKVAGAVLALALVRPRRVVLVAAWAGAVVLVLYGGLYVVGGALVLGGVVEVAGAVDRTALWWHVLV